jgi:hypothetical protein
MLAAEFESDRGVSKAIIMGNSQQCNYRGCQEKSANGAGMWDHLEKAHNWRDPPPDLGPWNILMDHLKHDENISMAGLFEIEVAFVCKHPNCGYAGPTERSLIAHNTQQHQGTAQWAKTGLTIHLGNATIRLLNRHRGSHEPNTGLL